MKDLINKILKTHGENFFEFTKNNENPVKHLKDNTKLVPNSPGVYLVFSKDKNNSNHLNFKISNKNYSLLYFGKAGGITNSGRVIIQGLNSRINNVVSDSARGLKDAKRAKYWNQIMLEFGIEKLYVVYQIHDAPQQLENIIYGYLDNNNLEYPLMNKKRGRLSIKNGNKVLKTIKKKESNNELADNKINAAFNKIDFDKLKDKTKKKLLIIPCSDKKRHGSFSNNVNNNYFINREYNFLLTARELRKFHYLDYMEINPNYFLYKKQNKPIMRDTNGNNLYLPVTNEYFFNCLSGKDYMPAFERYNGFYYGDKLRTLYPNKNRESNLHILIVSGLYGILEFRDNIVDYHFEIKNRPNIWGNCLTNTINKYIDENEINHDLVFYSLSDDYLRNITPNIRWKNIWINHDRGQTSARFLKDYFLPNI